MGLGTSWEVSRPQNLPYLGYLGGLILSYLTLSYLVLPYLTLSYLGYLAYLGHNRPANRQGLGPRRLLTLQDRLQGRF
eukprot:2245437-Karenia_brevis.AAC.1